MDGWFFVSGLNNENITCFLARKFLSQLSNFPMGMQPFALARAEVC